MIGVLVLVVAVAAVGVIALTSSTSTNLVDPDPLSEIRVRNLGLIVFSSNRDGNNEIYVMDAAGSGVTRLTNHLASDTFPSWSPNGEMIVFTSDRDGNEEIYVMDRDGSNQINVSKDPGRDYDPVWSPDSTKVLFTSERETGREVFVMNLDGSGQDRLSNNAGRQNSTAAWSPNGEKIAFTSYQGDLNISTIQSNGAVEIVLTDDPADDSSPAWSPDGTQIAFHSWRDGNPEIYVMKSDGTEPVRLTFDSAADFAPSWSRDGTKIVFESERDKIRGVYTINPDGTGLTRISQLGDSSPAWSPQPIPGRLKIFLVPSVSDPQSLSISNDGLGELVIVPVPLVRIPSDSAHDVLSRYLWGSSSLTFGGTGFSGVWSENDTARLVIQLNGPLTDPDYFQCVGLSINNLEKSASCGNGFHFSEFVAGGYTVALETSSIEAINPSDRLELSIVLGTTLPEGEKVVPNLVFGGDSPLKIGYLEIGTDR
jgi:dipeptidyl aminopeptidase/acylaminoacyl peptidase